MRYYSCKCGKSIAFGSMRPNPCIACPNCGTNLMGGKVVPHDFRVSKVETDDGKGELTVCIICGRTKKELENKLND